MNQRSQRDELIVLALFGGGLILIIVGIIGGLFLTERAAGLPNWAENVLVAIATGALIKMGDVLSALVALSNGRQVEGMSRQLANAGPPTAPIPEGVAEAAQQTADAAADEADSIAAREPYPEPKFGEKP
ncbi:hypothetical protein [Allopontixanthobacter sediminis]|uniref:Uncharacterized protein n=1 Tax=Allopontixanthobacter sediminis TaxID=1689985 RepID=A0A845AZZ6_9SPHN|nr:hypothetical protein [Allopontixanthobacter sediminis]MXP43002.1 hypothetical protein [Allopontixanthobacter sediminis]